MQLQPPVPCQPPSAVEPISDMHIYVVTPAFNAVQTINRTINSVISQSGDFTIHYHVQDGGSRDGTVELLQQWQHTLAQGLLPLSCRAVHFSYASAPDSGMYDAIQRGFARFALQPKHWITWINSDDLILPDSFSFIANIDKSPGLADSVNWVTGEAMILRNGSLFRCSRRALNADFVRAGLADGISAPLSSRKAPSSVPVYGCNIRRRRWMVFATPGTGVYGSTLPKQKHCIVPTCRWAFSPRATNSSAKNSGTSICWRSSATMTINTVPATAKLIKTSMPI